MTKLSVSDFTKNSHGVYNSADGRAWIVIGHSKILQFYARAQSDDWRNAYGNSTIDNRNGIASEGEAISWAVDVLNDSYLRLACSKLEKAFEAMGDWMRFVAPVLEAERAAERERCVSKVDEHLAKIKTALETCEDSSDIHALMEARAALSGLRADITK